MDYSGIICIFIRVLCIALGRVCPIVYLSKIDDYFHYNETICIGFKITYMVFRLPIKKDHLAVVPSSVAFLGEIFSIKIASYDIQHVKSLPTILINYTLVILNHFQ